MNVFIRIVAGIGFAVASLSTAALADPNPDLIATGTINYSTQRLIAAADKAGADPNDDDFVFFTYDTDFGVSRITIDDYQSDWTFPAYTGEVWILCNDNKVYGNAFSETLANENGQPVLISCPLHVLPKNFALTITDN